MITHWALNGTSLMNDSLAAGRAQLNAASDGVHGHTFPAGVELIGLDWTLPAGAMMHSASAVIAHCYLLAAAGSQWCDDKCHCSDCAANVQAELWRASVHAAVLMVAVSSWLVPGTSRYSAIGHALAYHLSAFISRPEGRASSGENGLPPVCM